MFAGAFDLIKRVESVPSKEMFLLPAAPQSPCFAQSTKKKKKPTIIPLTRYDSRQQLTLDRSAGKTQTMQNRFGET